MAQIVFANDRTAAVELTIEPWAMFESIPAGARVVIEFNDAPPPEIEFSLEESGGAFIYVNSEHVRVALPGEVPDFGHGVRAPTWRIFKKEK